MAAAAAAAAAATAACSRAGRLAVGAEAAATAAGTGGVGILDVESAAHQIVDVVDAGTADVKEARRIDDDAQAKLLKDLIRFLEVVVKGHAVLHPSAAAALDEDAQRVRLAQPLLIEDAAQLLGSHFCQSYFSRLCVGQSNVHQESPQRY